MFEYTICKRNEKGEEYLVCITGCRNEEDAKRILKKVEADRKTYGVQDDCELFVNKEEDKDCWWKHDRLD